MIATGTHGPADPRPRAAGAQSGSPLERWGGPLAAVVTALCSVAFAAVFVDGLWRRDAFDYAQIARELVEGEGFSSKQAIYALHLRFLQEHDLLHSPWPNLHRFPLPSIAIALCFLAFGVREAAVVAYGIVFQAATAWLLFRWALRAAGPIPAIASISLFALNGVMLEVGCSGLAEPAVMFFFTLSLYLLWRLSTGAGGAAAFWLGVSFGLAGLARTNAWFAAPLLLVWMLPPRLPGRSPFQGDVRGFLRRVGLLAAGALLVASPWMIRNWIVAGSPFFSLHTYYLLPSTGGVQKWDLSVPWVSDFVSPLDYARGHLPLIWAKWKLNFLNLARDFPFFAGTRLLPLCALIGVVIPTGKGLQRIAGFVFASYALTALLVSLTDVYFDKYYYHFLPAMILLAAASAWTLLGRLTQGRWRTPAFVVVVALMANLPGIVASGRSVRSLGREYSRDHMKFIEEHTKDDAVIFSDQSDAVAWVADRKSIRLHLDRLPNGEPTLAAARMNDEFLPIDGVYLSRTALMQLPEPIHDELKQGTRFRELFPHRHAFEDGSAFYYR